MDTRPPNSDTILMIYINIVTNHQYPISQLQEWLCNQKMMENIPNKIQYNNNNNNNNDNDNKNNNNNDNNNNNNSNDNNDNSNDNVNINTHTHTHTHKHIYIILILTIGIPSVSFRNGCVTCARSGGRWWWGPGNGTMENTPQQTCPKWKVSPLQTRYVDDSLAICWCFRADLVERGQP